MISTKNLVNDFDASRKFHTQICVTTINSFKNYCRRNEFVCVNRIAISIKWIIFNEQPNSNRFIGHAFNRISNHQFCSIKHYDLNHNHHWYRMNWNLIQYFPIYFRFRTFVNRNHCQRFVYNKFDLVLNVKILGTIEKLVQWHSFVPSLHIIVAAIVVVNSDYWW